MQALLCAVARALTKFGIAMAAKRPMRATTIMISTSVKPALRMFLICFIFILFVFLFYAAEQCGRRVDMMTTFVHLIACCNRLTLLAVYANKLLWQHRVMRGHYKVRAGRSGAYIRCHVRH